MSARSCTWKSVRTTRNLSVFLIASMESKNTSFPPYNPDNVCSVQVGEFLLCWTKWFRYHVEDSYFPICHDISSGKLPTERYIWMIIQCSPFSL